MAITKGQARAFLGPISDGQFDKIATFLSAEGFVDPDLDDFGGWVRELVTERIENKLHSMKRDQLAKENF